MADEPPFGRRGDDPWGQETVLDDLMACPAWQDWTPAGDDGDLADAKYDLSRAPDGPSADGPPGQGFSAGGAFDTARTGPALAGRADAAAGPGRDYAGLDDDQLIGVMVAWQKTEAWAAAGRLSAVAELICRRPAETSVTRRGFANKSSPKPADQASPPSAAGSSSAAGPSSAAGSPVPIASSSDASSPSASTPASPSTPASAAASDRASTPAGAASAGAGPGAGGLPLPGGFGGMGVRAVPATSGKFAADELAVALACSRWAAERMLALAYDLAARLPLTAAALHDGRIDAYKAQLIAEATRCLDDAAAAAAEAMIVSGVDGLTPGQIRVRIGRAVLKAGPTAGRRRREQAQKQARVLLWREDAGTAALCGYSLPPDQALAADQIVHAHAIELKAAGIPGTMDQLRARAYLDVLLGKDSAALARQEPRTSGGAPSGGEPGSPGSGEPGSPGGTGGGDSGTSEPGNPSATGGSSGNGSPSETGRSGETGRPAGAAGTTAGPSGALPARINLTIPLATLLGLADHPGEASGFGPVDADLARDMATRAAAHPSTRWCLTVTDPDGHPLAHGCARPGRRRKPGRGTARGSGPPGRGSGSPGRGMGPPGDYGTWRLPSGLLALRPDSPDLTFDLDPIAVTDCDHRYQTSAHDPGDRLRHLVQIRDAECTWPPCRRAARRCDFEHTIPWDQGGKTCACNGGPRCRHHHHQKQTPGWQVTQDRPGYHTWTTPSGRTYTNGPTTYPV